MRVNQKDLQPVLPEDFDVRRLRQLAREGRLYFNPKEPTETYKIEQRQALVLHYVEAINACVSPTEMPYITRIWKRIVSDPILNDRLFIQKGHNQGQLNRYRVMAIVTVLHEKNIYANGCFTLLQLHHRLEQTSQKDSIYTSRLNYALTRKQSRYLDSVMQKIRESPAE